MNNFFRITLCCVLSLVTTIVMAQAPTAKALVKEGIKLHDEGKYAEAIEKYKEALKLDPADPNAEYEMAYSMWASGKGSDAVPMLEKLVKAGGTHTVAAYDMLGSIYDDQKQREKAIEYYMAGLKVDSTYQRLYYNLGITYLGWGKYAEAEKWAIEAIKREPAHASSHWVYAMANYYQKKRINTVMTMSSFLLMEPQSPRAARIFQLMQETLMAGITKKDYKTINVNVSSDQLSSKGSSSELMASLLAASTAAKKLPPVESLQEHLTSIFNISSLADGGVDSVFFTTFYKDYFNKLAGSGNMPAFTRYISLSAFKDENIKWFNEHDAAIKALDAWATENKRKF